MENILLNNKLIRIGDKFQASDEELESIRKYFEVEEVKEEKSDESDDSVDEPQKEDSKETKTQSDDETSAQPFITEDETDTEVKNGFQVKKAKR